MGGVSGHRGVKVPNLYVLARRVLGRPTCETGESTRLLPSARIYNIGGPTSRISIGRHSMVAGELLVFPHGGRIVVGDWCFIGPGTRLWSGASITVGNRVLIAHDVNIFDNLTHPLNAEARHEHFKAISSSGHPMNPGLADAPVTIGDDAWIGAGAIILKGITIGPAAVVAAGSVVTCDVPANAVVAGNPARVIRDLATGVPAITSSGA